MQVTLFPDIKELKEREETNRKLSLKPKIIKESGHEYMKKQRKVGKAARTCKYSPVAFTSSW